MCREETVVTLTANGPKGLWFGPFAEMFRLLLGGVTWILCFLADSLMFQQVSNSFWLARQGPCFSLFCWCYSVLYGTWCWKRFSTSWYGMSLPDCISAQSVLPALRLKMAALGCTNQGKARRRFENKRRSENFKQLRMRNCAEHTTVSNPPFKCFDIGSFLRFNSIFVRNLIFSRN